MKIFKNDVLKRHRVVSAKPHYEDTESLGKCLTK